VRLSLLWPLTLVPAGILVGCATAPPAPAYLPIPAAYLQPCELPALPGTTADLSDAFVQAYRCAEIGNADKAAIRGLGQ
jgi:hypothetical protein